MVRFENGRPRKELWWQLAWFLLWIAITAFGFYLYPDARGHGTHQQLGLAPCPSMHFLERPCPGCGMTTSWTALMHGKLKDAFTSHWLGPPLYLLFASSGMVTGWAFFRGLRINTNTKAFNWTFIGVFILFVAYGALRFARVLP